MVHYFLSVILSWTLHIHIHKVNGAVISKIKRDFPLETKVTPYCNSEPRKIVVEGEVIRFSDFLKPGGTIDLHCGKEKNVSIVCVTASQKIIIDENFYAPGIQLYLISPLWKINGQRLINLNGLDGKRLPEKTKPGSMGYDGTNGNPGIPGSPGGSFFGLGERFVDGSYLTISVNGGDGGPGQDGGEGGGGSMGPHPDKDRLMKTLTCLNSPCNKEGTSEIVALDNNSKFTTFKCKEEYNFNVYDSFLLPPASGNHRECSYYIYGNPGVLPGGGGDGGAGGRGGHPGTIVIVELFERSGISKINVTGQPGAEGKGAQGGAHTYAGWNVSFKKRETYSSKHPRMTGNFTVRYIENTKKLTLSKSVGVDGKNTRGMLDPALPEQLSIQMIFNVMENNNVPNVNIKRE